MSFEEYLKDNLESVRQTTDNVTRQNLRDEFVKEFPLDRIREMDVKDYCLGTAASKESLCYLIEFGKYKQAGFGIGGGTANKYGVYFSKKDNCYKQGSKPVDIEKFWPDFRNELYRFLIDSNSEQAPVVLEE